MRIYVMSLVALVVVGGACTNTDASTEPPGSAATAPQPDPQAGVGVGAITSHEQVGTELPEALVAELRRQGDDSHGRLLTLAPGFIATAACSDCGAPSYLRFMAVRCADPHHCEVLTEQCEGDVSRDADTYLIELHAVEGGADGDAQVCAGYSGVFESP